MKAFPDWVTKQGGPNKVASILGVSHWAVRIWMKRRGYPQVETIVKIISLSKGALTFEEIVSWCRPKGGRV